MRFAATEPSISLAITAASQRSWQVRIAHALEQWGWGKLSAAGRGDPCFGTRDIYFMLVDFAAPIPAILIRHSGLASPGASIVERDKAGPGFFST